MLPLSWEWGRGEARISFNATKFVHTVRQRFFLNRHSLGCCKPLVLFQSSKKVNSHSLRRCFCFLFFVFPSTWRGTCSVRRSLIREQARGFGHSADLKIWLVLSHKVPKVGHPWSWWTYSTSQPHHDHHGSLGSALLRLKL